MKWPGFVQFTLPVLFLFFVGCQNRPYVEPNVHPTLAGHQAIARAFDEAARGIRLPPDALLVALGDSLTTGSDTEKQIGWQYFFFNDQKKIFPGLFNLNRAHGAWRTDEVISSEMLAVPTGSVSPAVVTVMIGLNDLRYFYPGQAPASDHAWGSKDGMDFSFQFKSRLEQGLLRPLRNKARYPNVRYIFLSTIYDPTDGAGYWAGGWPDSPKVFGQYNDRIRELAPETGCILVDIAKIFQGKAADYIIGYPVR